MRSRRDRRLHPCAFFSWRFSSAEKNYDIGVRELLAMKQALEAFNDGESLSCCIIYQFPIDLGHIPLWILSPVCTGFLKWSTSSTQVCENTCPHSNSDCYEAISSVLRFSCTCVGMDLLFLFERRAAVARSVTLSYLKIPVFPVTFN